MIKEFTDQYGHLANFHIADTTENLKEQADGAITCSFKFKAFIDEQAYLDGKSIVDCFRPVLKYSITQEELLNAEGATLGAKMNNAFSAKATESVLNEEGKETNVFNGNVGTIDYIIGN
ncbi:MAG: hypothetical protein U9O94_00725 [Nanoarchaeota archaeon]|nr:hypothetical protein [Nanoarchaeota archaeon]